MQETSVTFLVQSWFEHDFDPPLPMGDLGPALSQYSRPLPLPVPRGHTDHPWAVLQEVTSPNVSLNILSALICLDTMINNNLALEPHVPG